MKSIVIKIILSFIFLLCLDLKAQNKVDSILFDMINKYRVQHRLAPFVWDSCAYKMAQHHSKYLTLINDSVKKSTDLTIFTHEENVSVSGYESLKTMEDRFFKFQSKKIDLSQILVLRENIAGCFIYDKESDYDVAKKIFLSWKQSPEHNKIMLTKSKKPIYGACTKSTVINHITVTIKNRDFVSVLNRAFFELNIYSYE